METTQNYEQTAEQKGGNRKWVLIFAVLLVCSAVGLAIYWKGQGPSLGEDEQIVYQNAAELRNKMESPDYFGLTDMLLLKKIAEDGSIAYTYTIFDYVGTDKYGSLIGGEAIFKDHDYVMDYTPDPIKDDAEKMEVQFEIKKYRQEGGKGNLRAVVIDTEKILEKLGLNDMTE